MMPGDGGVVCFDDDGGGGEKDGGGGDGSGAELEAIAEDVDLKVNDRQTLAKVITEFDFLY